MWIPGTFKVTFVSRWRLHPGKLCPWPLLGKVQSQVKALTLNLAVQGLVSSTYM